MLRLVTVAFEQHIRLADGKGLRVDLLAEQVDGDALAAAGRQRLKSVLRHREHTARTAGSVNFLTVFNTIQNGLHGEKVQKIRAFRGSCFLRKPLSVYEIFS